MMNIDFDVVLALAPYVVGFLAWMNKDRILHVLNVKKQKSEIDNNNLGNTEEIVELYKEALDDLKVRNEQSKIDLKKDHEIAIRDVQIRYDYNIENIKKKTEEKYKDKIEAIESEFAGIVEDLKKQLVELKQFIRTLTEERDFYKGQLDKPSK